MGSSPVFTARVPPSQRPGSVLHSWLILCISDSSVYAMAQPELPVSATKCSTLCVRHCPQCLPLTVQSSSLSSEVSSEFVCKGS